MTEMRTEDTDVLVVGGGPTGLIASALLGRQGVDAITITKHGSTRSHPRAVYINQRTVEIFRELGAEDELRRVGIPIRTLGNNVWATSFAGTELARIHAWGTGPDRRGEYEATSPCEILNAPQHALEPVALDAARKAGAEIRFQAELEDLTEDDHYVTATIHDWASGQRYRVRARYLIGADGGGSLVAQKSGIPYEAKSGVLNRAVNVFLETDLSEYCAHRPALMYCIYPPGERFHSCTWITISPWSEWVMSVIYPSDEEPALDEQEAIGYARAMIGNPDADVRVNAMTTWSVDKAVAATFRRGRILLAGDSAHRNPPPNGLGSNTGMQDALNLCWKLAMVLHGHAGDDLLDSYHAERKAVANAVLGQTMQSLRYMDDLVRALGVDAEPSTDRAWQEVAELSADSERGRQRRRELRHALELQQYHFNCHGTEAGIPYTEQARQEDGEAPRRSASEQLHYMPSTAAGHHLPHAWIERDRMSMSTLDVAPGDRFTLITGASGAQWADAAEHASRRLGLPIATVVIDHFQQYHDTYGTWADVREVDEDGCLLVRPDHRIAWRSPGPAAAPADELHNALSAALGNG
ncbi:MAG: 2,4-dichlorophenol 6-monooxygenase [Pseudonocardiaceae bacterium]|nr:2,4-dichlorophenol 6-monooxygenase [Pseudonocardiaceae bacterium]